MDITTKIEMKNPSAPQLIPLSNVTPEHGGGGNNNNNNAVNHPPVSETPKNKNSMSWEELKNEALEARLQKLESKLTEEEDYQSDDIQRLLPFDIPESTVTVRYVCFRVISI